MHTPPDTFIHIVSMEGVVFHDNGAVYTVATVTQFVTGRALPSASDGIVSMEINVPMPDIVPDRTISPTTSPTTDDSVSGRPTGPIDPTPVKRPRRAAAILATQNIQDVLDWERCKESSTMFKSAAAEINEEFDRLTRGECSFRKRPTPITDTVNPEEAFGASVGSSGVVPVLVPSDDEGNADADDRFDQMDSENDDTESIMSFVVPDDDVPDSGTDSAPSSQDEEERAVETDSEDDKSSLTCSDDSDERDAEWSKLIEQDTQVGEPSEIE